MRQILFPFSDPGALAPWRPLHDTVMGGRSTGALEAGPGCAVFSGVLSLENGGGFASVRADLPPLALRGASGLAFRVRGDGRRYWAFVKTDAGPGAGDYRAPLDLPAGRWEDVAIPFASFRASLRGREVPGAGPPAGESVVVVGLMASDRREGPFRLEVAGIAADLPDHAH